MSDSRTPAAGSSRCAVKVLRVGGAEELLELPRHGLLTAIRSLLGCEMVDTVNLRDGTIMIVDDEGHLAGKPRNEAATARYQAVTRPGSNWIAGDVAIAIDEDFA